MVYFPIITGPVAPYSNVAIQSQFYEPSQFYISSITLGTTTTVTTVINNNFVIGQQVRLVIPPQFGCRQLNEEIGNVILQPAPNQVVLDINSSQFDTFTASTAATQPQILPVGDINSGVTNASGRSPTGTFIPGSFLNISPQ